MGTGPERGVDVVVVGAAVPPPIPPMAGAGDSPGNTRNVVVDAFGPEAAPVSLAGSSGTVEEDAPPSEVVVPATVVDVALVVAGERTSACPSTCVSLLPRSPSATNPTTTNTTTTANAADARRDSNTLQRPPAASAATDGAASSGATPPANGDLSLGRSTDGPVAEPNGAGSADCSTDTRAAAPSDVIFQP